MFISIEEVPHYRSSRHRYTVQVAPLSVTTYNNGGGGREQGRTGVYLSSQQCNAFFVLPSTFDISFIKHRKGSYTVSVYDMYQLLSMYHNDCNIEPCLSSIPPEGDTMLERAAAAIGSANRALKKMSERATRTNGAASVPCESPVMQTT